MIKQSLHLFYYFIIFILYTYDRHTIKYLDIQ